MLKKILHIILILLIITSTTGVTIYKHYCGKNFISKSIIFSPKDCCKSKCNDCKTEIKQLKISDNFKISLFNFNFDKTSTKIFDLSKNSIVLLKTYSLSFILNLTYKAKICDIFIIPEFNSISYLQVFRL